MSGSTYNASLLAAAYAIGPVTTSDTYNQAMMKAAATIANGGIRQQLRYSTVCCIGDSLGAGSANNNSYYNLLLQRAGQFRNVGNFAIAGTRSDQILATQVPQAIASGAQYCFENSGTNDVAQSISEAVLRANRITIWNTLRAAGVEPIVTSLLPSNTPANAIRNAAHNVWAKLYCLKNGITFIDFWPLLATSTGAYVSGLNADVTHPNTIGAIAMANKVAARMASPWLIDPLLALTDTGSDACTYIANAVSFTDTNSDGVPDSWFASGSGGTYSVTAADSGDFGKWARCALSAGTNVGLTATAATLSAIPNNDGLGGTGWAIGDVLAIGAKVRWVDTSQALAVSMNQTGAGFSQYTPGMGNQPMFQEKGGTTGDTRYVYFEQLISSGTVINLQPFASGTGYFEINRPIVVNLSKLGLS